MVNTTFNQLLFAGSKRTLGSDARSALIEAARVVMANKGVSEAELARVTGKVTPGAGFAKMTAECLRGAPATKFDERYVQTMLDVCLRKDAKATSSELGTLALSPSLAKRYSPFARHLAPGLGATLVLMHARRQVVLPIDFRWPVLRGIGSVVYELGPHLDDGLIKLVRSAHPSNDSPPDSLGVLSNEYWARVDFTTRGTRSLLPLGWLQPEDAKLEDVETLIGAIESTGKQVGRVTPYLRQLVLLFGEHYGSAFGIRLSDFDALIQNMDRRVRRAHRDFATAVGDGRVEPLRLRPRDASIARLERLQFVPGLDVKLSEIADVWLSIEKGYLGRRKRKVQRTRGDVSALSYLNIYLFFYLPYWFSDHPDSKLEFPASPKLLLTAVFVSPIIELEQPAPLRLTEFVESYAKQRGLESYYAPLKAIEAFFEYIAQHAKELPDADGFTQPLSAYDLPPVSRTAVTNKRPIPRQLFPFYIGYADAVLCYCEVLLERVLSGQISQADLHSRFTTIGGLNPTIDTRASAGLVGMTPVAQFKGRWYGLAVIPNVFYVDESFPLTERGRDWLKVPQPHALVQVLVGLYTGIRHQHIQWLDARTFDGSVRAGRGDEFAALNVNTDKVRRSPWAAHVNVRVIELLHVQKRWRDVINHAGFRREIFYEHNEHTHWAPIVPLFSWAYDGSPHSDSRYQEAWARLMMGVVGMFPALGVRVSDFEPLYRFLPAGVGLDDPEELKRSKFGPASEWSRAIELGASAAYVPVFPKGSVTPHSARVGVISHYIQYLPADLIGRSITGQKEAAVYHYVKVDPAELAKLQDRQAAALHVSVFGQDMDEIASTGEGPTRYIKADQVNSALAAGLRTRRVDETIADFGCISLVLNDAGKSGLDVLRETQGLGVAFNKTEICPYGNRCPPDVVKKLRGWGRCGICSFAVRSIDNLPAIGAKRRQLIEGIEVLEQKLEGPESERFTAEELATMADERQRLSEEAIGYRLAEEVLERLREAIAAGSDSRRWTVGTPEIIAERLAKVEFPTAETAYVLARLAECVAYPTLDTPALRAKFDLLRRQLLAKSGRIREALRSEVPGDVAAACIAQIKVLAAANGIPLGQVSAVLQSDVESTLAETALLGVTAGDQ